MDGSGNWILLRVGFDEKPFEIFVLKGPGELWVGRKKPTLLGTEPHAPKTVGCLVEPSMILGRLDKMARMRGHYAIAYAPPEPSGAQAVFDRIDGQWELTYPLLRLRNGAEVAQPPEFWDRSALRSGELDAEEEVMREEVCRLLDGKVPGEAVIYDPACSTGAFLARLERQFPGARLIGQERSSKMASVARERLGEVHLGDSHQPACAPGSVDVAICRHLNLDVVTSAEARELFKAAAGTLRPGGLMVVLGHTPILINGAWMEGEGFEILNRCARTQSGRGVFQLYLLRRCANSR